MRASIDRLSETAQHGNELPHGVFVGRHAQKLGMRSANSCMFVLGVSLMLLIPFRLIVAPMTRIVTTAYRYRRTLVFGVAIAVASCSPVETYNRTDRATGQAFASRGDVMLRVDKRDDLPNDRGFAELRYMGTNSAGQAVFRRTDVGIGASAPPATVGAPPPDAVQFALDPTLGRTITIHDHGVEILQFNRAGVQYRVW